MIVSNLIQAGLESLLFYGENMCNIKHLPQGWRDEGFPGSFPIKQVSSLTQSVSKVDELSSETFKLYLTFLVPPNNFIYKTKFISNKLRCSALSRCISNAYLSHLTINFIETFKKSDK